jgi:cyclohexanone monooxygenase
VTPDLQALAAELGIDPEELRLKYRAERDRRLRPDGLGQFVRIDREHHHRYQEDPRPAQAHRATAAALKPWYDRFCKRPCFHDDYLPTFNRPNVTLVDTQGQGVDRITPQGVVANGREYPLDCLIYSTGYDASSPYAQRISFAIVGRDGATLKDKWAGGALTFHGYATHGFPNMFIMSHVQTGLSLNFPHMIGEQARHVAWILSQAKARGAVRIEATQAAEDAWVAQIDAAAVSMVEALRECTPSYFNHEGNVSRLNARNSAYGGGALAFYQIIADWRAEGSLAGLELTQG